MPKFQKKQSDVTEKTSSFSQTLTEQLGQSLLNVAANELSLEQAEAGFRSALLSLTSEERAVQVPELDFTYGRLHNALPHLHQAFKRALASVTP